MGKGGDRIKTSKIPLEIVSDSPAVKKRTVYILSCTSGKRKKKD